MYIMPNTNINLVSLAPLHCVAGCFRKIKFRILQNFARDVDAIPIIFNIDNLKICIKYDFVSPLIDAG